MQRNTDKCGHCDLVFKRQEQVAFINRSDGRTFHLRLLSTWNLSQSSRDDLPPNSVICNFAYASEMETRAVTVIILSANGGTTEARTIEHVADKLAHLLETGQQPQSAYMEFPE